jgi:hypothetical protein
LAAALLYRSDVKEAIKIFRPVLQALKIRSDIEHPLVFFAAFEQLSHLAMDECSLQVLVADIDTLGIFAIKYTKQGLLRAFIILSNKLYNNSNPAMKELRKIAGVHEFVHFISIVYVATVTGTVALRARLLERLQQTIKKLPGANLLAVYSALTSKVEPENAPVELTDTHFRLGYEGNTPDYAILFNYFMFSRELFEIYFDIPKQNQFRDLILTGNNDKAIQLLIGVLNKASKDKDVPVALAFRQLLEWVHIYTRNFTS